MSDETGDACVTAAGDLPSESLAVNSALPDPRDVSRLGPHNPLLSTRQARILLGETLYAVQLDDGVIKIGWTTNLARRIYELGNCQLLAIRRGSPADEARVHRSLVAHLHHGREYYRPEPPVLELVGQWRADLGLDPLLA